MAKLYIADAAGQQTLTSEEEARAQWQSGSLSRHNSYWRPGMSGWLPLAELFGAPAAEVNAPAPGPPPLPRGFVIPQENLTRLVLTMLRISLATSAISALVAAAVLLVGKATDDNERLRQGVELAEGGVNLVQSMVFLMTSISFLRWVHRANVNARGLGAQGMKFTPGWAVGWFFVPIALLWKPFHAMKQLWQASCDPEHWAAQEPPAKLNTWWMLWLLWNILGQLYFHLTLRGQSLALAAAVCGLLSDLAGIPLCLALMRVVTSIDEMQRAWAKRPA